MNATKEQLLELADKFVSAGNGYVDITPQDVALLGADIEVFPSGKWFDFCRVLYKKINGDWPSECPYRGRGISSRWYGELIANLIRKKAHKTTEVES